MTPRQVLVHHIESEHGNLDARERMSFAELGRWHARQHHRLRCNHFHDGPNRGPDRRPPGWYTGEDSVRRT